MALTQRVQNQSTVGSSRGVGTSPGIQAVDTPSGTASGLVLLDSAGVEYVLWVKSSGELYIGTRSNFATPDAAGTKVGAQ